MWIPSQPRGLVAQIYLAASLLVGVPSVIIFVYSAWSAIQLHVLTPPKTAPGAPTGNPIIDGLTAGATLAAKAFSFLGNATEWVMIGAAVATFFLSVMAAVVFAVARGLHAGCSWARVLGILLAIAPLLVSIAILASNRRPMPVALGAAGTLLAGYSIWVLCWRFA